jgi:hypothetical protein
MNSQNTWFISCMNVMGALDNLFYKKHFRGKINTISTQYQMKYLIFLKNFFLKKCMNKWKSIFISKKKWCIYHYHKSKLEDIKLKIVHIVLNDAIKKR